MRFIWFFLNDSLLESKAISALATDEHAEIIIERRNGSDGTVTVKLKTLELDASEHTASADVDFKHVEETVVFENGETEKTVLVPIIQKDEEHRNDSFAVQLSDVTPSGAKLSKKAFMIVTIVTDVETKKRNEILN